MSNYETMMVISTRIDEEERSALIKRFTNLISDNGNVVSVDEWGKRRLAYEINKETEGYYVLVTFQSEPDFIIELERVYRITDNFLRTLVIKLERPLIIEKPQKEAEAEEIEEAKPVTEPAAEGTEAEEKTADEIPAVQETEEQEAVAAEETEPAQLQVGETEEVGDEPETELPEVNSEEKND